ncbi:hypothetical protein HYT23_01470 [Candidatus Pacearchaeota archaeon]|nr:hypothetical protein [Candidatus Pacearchaeota archaeon]
MNLKKCPSCSAYTLKEICGKCQKKTKDAHYKFVNVKK